MDLQHLIKAWNEHVDRRYFQYGDIREMDDEAWWDELWARYHSRLLVMVQGLDFSKAYVLYDEEAQAFFSFSTEDEFVKYYGKEWYEESY